MSPFARRIAAQVLPPGTRSPSPTSALPLLLAVSGAAALAYETLWVRDFALVLGSTATALAAVVAVYFAGLALGALLGRRLAARSRDLRPYGLLELGVALAVTIYVACRGELAPLAAGASGPAERLALVLAALAVPSTLLGATLPAAAAVLAPGDTAAAGRLYAWNTLGGAAGAVAGGLLGVHLIGIHATYLAAIAASAAAGLAALALRVPRAESAAAPPAPAVLRAARATTVAALVGGVAMANEVLLGRALAGTLSNSVYSTAIVLAAVLLGIVAGAFVGARGRSERALAVACLLTTASSLAVLPLIARLPAMSRTLAAWVGVAGPGGGLVVEGVLAAVLILVPAACAGAVFPLAVTALGERRVGVGLGHIAAANTAAGIVGSLAAGFVLLPVLGLGGALCASAMLAAVAAALAARGALRALAVVVTLGLAAAVLHPPRLLVPWRGQHPGQQILFYRDGAAATVAVTVDPSGARRLLLNGQYSLGGGAGVLLDRREAHLPLLLHPRPERALMLGIGTGSTMGAALRHPDLDVDGVEVVPEVLEAARAFADDNEHLTSDLRARLIVDDARSHLLADPTRYDVIVSDLFLPWTAGAGSLYSLDFYRLVRRRLAPGGLFCQWLPLHQLALGDLRRIVRTFLAAFPDATLWTGYHRTRTPIVALIGSMGGLRVSRSALAARMRAPGLAEPLAQTGLVAPGDVAALFVAGAQMLRAFAGDGTLNTDDHPRLELSAPAAYFRQSRLGRDAVAALASHVEMRPGPLGPGPGANGRLRELLLRAQVALLSGDLRGEARAYLAALEAPGAPATVTAALSAIAAERTAAGDARTAEYVRAALREAAQRQAASPAPPP